MNYRFIDKDDLNIIRDTEAQITIVTLSGKTIANRVVYSFTDETISCGWIEEARTFTIPWRNIDYIIEENIE